MNTIYFQIRAPLGITINDKYTCSKLHTIHTQPDLSPAVSKQTVQCRLMHMYYVYFPRSTILHATGGLYSYVSIFIHSFHFAPLPSDLWYYLKFCSIFSADSVNPDARLFHNIHVLAHFNRWRSYIWKWPSWFIVYTHVHIQYKSIWSIVMKTVQYNRVLSLTTSWRGTANLFPWHYA